VQATGLQASEQEADALSGSCSGVKESTEIHPPPLDASESGIAGCPDMHLEIMGQFQTRYMALQSDPWRGLPHATCGPDDPFPGPEAGFGHKVAAQARESFLQAVVE
jgi:hypothetical protein